MKLNRKSYPMHKINEILFKLEYFDYVMSFGLNMGKISYPN